MFDPVDPRQSFPALERGILKYWHEQDAFKRSVRLRSQQEGSDLLEGIGTDSESRFSFFDGPPFATGLPHYGHLLAGTIKDVIPRYQTMRGKRVERRFGWDCHGLPIENMIEKEHGLKDKKQIEEMGVKAFNDLCRSAVQRYTKEWRTVVERMGRWVDMDWDYRTMDPEFMESIWWAFKTIYDKKLIYEGFKPMHICPRCATPLSNFEVTQGYKDRTDQSVIMTFPLTDDPATILLAWTTTPWSLPGNFWLAVGAHIAYVKVECEGKTYVLAEKLVTKVFGKKEHSVTAKVKPKELAGKRYMPLFPYFVDTVISSTSKEKKSQTYGDRVFKVIMNNSVVVSDEEGTGIVHLTSSTGEDSHATAMAEKVDVLPHVQMDGYFVPAVTDFQGIHVKPEGKDPMSTDKLIIDWLKKHHRMFSSFTINHSYPHCWRCDTPLLPYVTASWFVAVEKIKERMLEANAKTRWVPDHIRDGRFGKWLEGARDWAISRSRYWGTPLPIWRCKETGEIEVIGSREELMQRKPLRFTRVTILRHGESEGNLIPVYQAKLPGTDLTERGKAQAKATGAMLSGRDVTRIYASPLARTQQTAGEILKQVDDADLVTDDRLREVEFGEYEGKTIDFSDLTFVKARRAHKLESDQIESIFHFPGMETWSHVQARMRSFLEEMLPKHRGEHIVIVTHADPLINVKHFFNGEDPKKLTNQPYPSFAEPFEFFWDHDRQAAMDLHKESVDDLAWTVSGHETSVDMTVVRHGETNWNKEERSQGQEADQDLNETGVQQAKDLAKSLKGKKYDGIITSDLTRAVSTAKILSEELDLPILAQWEELRERATGEWSGRLVSEILKEFPSVDASFMSTTFHYATPKGGESLTEFLRRIDKAYERFLREMPGKKLLVVCHGGTFRALGAVTNRLTYREAIQIRPKNGATLELQIHPLLRRIPEVLDCWFESGSMPYAQSHYPFSQRQRDPNSPITIPHSLPQGFPANFIAENLDQTRGWFYTLMVLSTALFDLPAFMNCICGGIILAGDGKKMSKRLKNYPDPMDLMELHGADALRFALMSSPVVRAETLRFSEQGVKEAVQNILLPLWNTYSFFVTYANAAKWDTTASRRTSNHPLDRWIRAEVQDLTNRMTEQLDSYDLSATCAELHDTVDALTNWYVRLSRRRFAGKAGLHSGEEAMEEMNEQTKLDALGTLYDVLLTITQLIAPFCPFIAEAIYLNLAAEEHGSVHFTDWPEIKKLTAADHVLLDKTRLLRAIVSLGLQIRSGQKIGLRQPLAKATVAVPPSMMHGELSAAELSLLQDEINVKTLEFTEDPGALAERIAMVDAKKVGPRLGGRVQELIAAGKRGDFGVQEDGSVLILDERLSADEVSIMYRGREGEGVATDRGIVVALDMRVTRELENEGLARELIRSIQRLRKEAGYEMGETIAMRIEGADDIVAGHGATIQSATCATHTTEHTTDAFLAYPVTIGDNRPVTIFLPMKP